MFWFCINSVFTDSRKCFQIYMSNLGIMNGFFQNFNNPLISYHLTCRHYYIMKSLLFISKTCILSHAECRIMKFHYRNSSSSGSIEHHNTSGLYSKYFFCLCVCFLFMCFFAISKRLEPIKSIVGTTLQ